MRAFTDKYLKYVILVLAAAFLIYGIFRGELEDVFIKAAAICLECCGIG